MNTHVAEAGWLLRGDARDVPERAIPAVAEQGPKTVASIGLLDRLADWCERQPLHHRMGSFTRR